MKRDRCEDCPAEIIRATHSTRGSAMCFDAHPYREEDIKARGQWILVKAEMPDADVPTPAVDAEGQVPVIAYYFGKRNLPEGVQEQYDRQMGARLHYPVFVDHHVTCPGPRGRAVPEKLEPALAAAWRKNQEGMDGRTTKGDDPAG